MSFPSRLNSFSTDEKPVVALWGCELNDTTRRYVIEVEDDLFEHLVFLKTVSLGEDVNDKPHLVVVESKNSLKPVPVVCLRRSVLPMACLDTFELIPPVAFILKSGTGPVYLHGQHLTLDDDSDYEPPPEDEPLPDEAEDETEEANPEEEEEEEDNPPEEEEEEANEEPDEDNQEPDEANEEPNDDYEELDDDDEPDDDNDESDDDDDESDDDDDEPDDDNDEPDDDNEVMESEEEPKQR